MQDKSSPSSGLWHEAISMVAEPANRLSLPTLCTHASDISAQTVPVYSGSYDD